MDTQKLKGMALEPDFKQKNLCIAYTLLGCQLGYQIEEAEGDVVRGAAVFRQSFPMWL